MKLQLPVFAALLLTLCVANTLSAQTSDLTLEEINSLYKTKTHSAVSVHDPSAVHSSGKTFYVIGSHRGWARSTDNMVNWTGLNSGSLFGKANASGQVSTIVYADAFSTHAARSVKTVVDGEEREVPKRGHTATRRAGTFQGTCGRQTLSIILIQGSGCYI